VSRTGETARPEASAAVERLVALFATAPADEVAEVVAGAELQDVRGALRRHIPEALDGRTALQKHLLVFDLRGDGRLSWSDTFRGFRDVGLAPSAAMAITTMSHVVMGFPSSGRALDWTMSLARIHLARHAADTGLFDESLSPADLGRRIDELVARYGRTEDGRLGMKEFEAMIADNAARDRRKGVPLLRRTIGRSASSLEFGALVQLAGRRVDGESRTVSRDDLVDLYSGVLMYALLPPKGLAAAILRLRDLGA